MLRQYFNYDKMHSFKSIQSYNLLPYLDNFNRCNVKCSFLRYDTLAENQHCIWSIQWIWMEWTYICRLTWCYKCHYTNDGITNCEYGPENSDGFWVPDVFCRVEMRCVHVFDLCAHFGRSNLDRLKEEKNIRKAAFKMES